MSEYLRLTFVRHADYLSGGEDAQLSEQGMVDAQNLAMQLEENGYLSEKSYIRTSPTYRAKQTAQIIALNVGAVVTSDEGLRLWREVEKTDGKVDSGDLSDVVGLLDQLVSDTSFNDSEVIIVSHKPNIILLSALFAENSGKCFELDYCGAVSFEIPAESWLELDGQVRGMAMVTFSNRAAALDIRCPL